MTAPEILTKPERTILDRWGVTPDELTILVEANPSLRGMMLGYVAELQLLKRFFSLSEHISYSVKSDDHDRGHKGDRLITYKGHQFIVEAKSLQTNSIKRTIDESGNPRFVGKAQVDASDRRAVAFADRSTLETTCLLCGEFDLLAVNCFAFEEKWHFAFAKNGDLPRSTFRKYTPYQRQNLLASLVTVRWPPDPPFYSDPFPILEELARDRSR